MLKNLVTYFDNDQTKVNVREFGKSIQVYAQTRDGEETPLLTISKSYDGWEFTIAPKINYQVVDNAKKASEDCAVRD